MTPLQTCYLSFLLAWKGPFRPVQIKLSFLTKRTLFIVGSRPPSWIYRMWKWPKWSPFSDSALGLWGMNRKDGPLRNHASIWPFSGLIGGIINAEGGKGPAESCLCPGTVHPLGAQLSHRDEEPNRWPCHVPQLLLLHKHYLPLPPGALCWNGWMSITSNRWTRGGNALEFDQNVEAVDFSRTFKIETLLCCCDAASLVTSRDSTTLALTWFLSYDDSVAHME